MRKLAVVMAMLWAGPAQAACFGADLPCRLAEAEGETARLSSELAHTQALWLHLQERVELETRSTRLNVDEIVNLDRRLRRLE